MAHVTWINTFKSLRFQLGLLVFLPLTLLGTVVVWTTYHAVENLVEYRLQKEIELVARAVRVPVEKALHAQDLVAVQQTLDAVFEMGRVYGAYVYDADGHRVAVAGEGQPGRREQYEAAELVELGEELGRYAELGGAEVFSYFVPLTGQIGRIEGLLQVVRLESDIADRLAAIRTRGWLTWGVSMGIMLMILIVGHRRAVGRHVQRLVDSMARIESGDRRHRAGREGPTELSGVAGALNRMLDSLDRMAEELNAQRRARQGIAEQMRAQEHLVTLGRFSSGVAHELGAPLSVIDGDSRRLQRMDLQDDDARRRLGRIRSQVRRTRELISQLMEFARRDRRDRTPVPVGKLIDRAMAGVRPESEARGIAVAIGEVSEEVIVHGWAVRLEQALVNLLRNAVQAADSEVSVRVESSDSRVTIGVEDDGKGVPKAERRRIFEPFHTAGKGRQGTGLGLAIVRSVVEEHGAEIRVCSSERLGGSRFELVLARAES
jgi:signal transduction histidine kinase